MLGFENPALPLCDLRKVHGLVRVPASSSASSIFFRFCED